MDSMEKNGGYLMTWEEFPDHLRISASELYVGRLLGTGFLSRVYKGNWLRCEVVAKQLPVQDISGIRFESYPKELEILIRLPHPHGVQLLGYNVNSKRVCIVMESLETRLTDVIRDRIKTLYRPFTLCEAVDIISKISLGMWFLHTRGVTQGGLTHRIILMNVHDQGEFDVKIGGFAFSHYGNRLPTSDNNMYMFTLAPDIQSGKANAYRQLQKGTKAADVYSFAFICYAILTGCFPRLWVNIASEHRPKLPPDIDHDLAELIRKCWDANPDNRPEFSDVCNTRAEFRVARDIRVPQQTTVTEDCEALRWTTHKDDEDNTCLEIAKILETLPNHLSVDPVDVRWRRCIGEGGYSKVYEVDWLGCTFAMKRFKSLSESLKDEVEFLAKLQHPHIARLIDLSVNNNGGWTMMERANTDLRKLIDSRVQFVHEAGRTSTIPFSEEKARELCLKIALGMKFLHSRKVIHRDLKAANVLVHDHRGRFDVKITGFGVSHRIGNPDAAISAAGTGFWRAPEVLKAKSDKPLTEDQLKKTNVFSYAMTCYEIITGNVPFGGKVVDAFCRDFHSGVRSNNVIEGWTPKLPAELKADLVKLISACWDDDPAKRPDFSTICKVLDNESTWDFNLVALFNRFLRDKWFLFTEGLRRKGCFLGSKKDICRGKVY